MYSNVKLNCTLVQALRLSTGLMAHRGVEVRLYPILGTALESVEGLASRPAPLFSPERPGTYCTGVLMGPSTGLDRNEKFRPHRHSIPGPHSQLPVPIMTTLPGPKLCSMYEETEDLNIGFARVANLSTCSGRTIQDHLLSSCGSSEHSRKRFM